MYSATAVVKGYVPGYGFENISDCGSTRDSSNFIVASAPAPTEKAAVVEFYNAALDHFFITQDSAEIFLLDRGVAWKRTGQSFLAYLPTKSDGRGESVARYYGLPAAGLDSHFYSWNWWEIYEMSGISVPYGGWQLETYGAFAVEIPDWPGGTCRTGTIPIYRLWNGRSDSAHRYTTDASIKQTMIVRGYVAEGFGPDTVFMCALSS